MVKFIIIFFVIILPILTIASGIEFIPHHAHRNVVLTSEKVEQQKQSLRFTRQHLFKTTVPVSLGIQEDLVVKVKNLPRDIFIAMASDDLVWLEGVNRLDYESPVLIIIGANPSMLKIINENYPTWPLQNMAGIGLLREKGIENLPVIIRRNGEVWGIE